MPIERVTHRIVSSPREPLRLPGEQTRLWLLVRFRNGEERWYAADDAEDLREPIEVVGFARPV